jgi:hypothetical protein
MYRVIVALFFLVASVAASSAQGLIPAVWQGEHGSLMKVVRADSGTGTFDGVFISNPTGPCPAVPFDLAGRTRGQRVAFRTSRTWTFDCRMTVIWSGRLIGQTTLAARWRATRVVDGRVVRARGTEIFRRV